MKRIRTKTMNRLLTPCVALLLAPLALVHAAPAVVSSLAAGRIGTPSQGNIYLLFEGGPSKWDEVVQVAAFNLSWLLDGRDIATLIGKPR